MAIFAAVFNGTTTRSPFWIVFQNWLSCAAKFSCVLSFSSGKALLNVSGGGSGGGSAASGSRWVVFLHLAGDAGACRASLREIRHLVRAVLKDLGAELRQALCQRGAAVDPPEQLLSALLLQAFYSIRSERQLMEQLDYNLLYRWFAGLAPDDPVWDATTFSPRTGSGCSAATCFRSS